MFRLACIDSPKLTFGIEFHPDPFDLLNDAWDRARERQFAAGADR